MYIRGFVQPRKHRNSQFKIDTRSRNCIFTVQMSLSKARYFGWFSGYYYPAAQTAS